MSKGTASVQTIPHKKRPGTVPKDVALTPNTPTPRVSTSYQYRKARAALKAEFTEKLIAAKLTGKFIVGRGTGEQQRKKALLTAEYKAKVEMMVAEMNAKGASVPGRCVKGSMYDDVDIPGVSSQAPPDDSDDISAVNRMIDDLRYAYRHAVGPNGLKGRLRLLELMKNDGEFKGMMKELLRIESALKQAEIRSKADKGGGSGGGNNNFFLIVKGLESEKSIMKMAGLSDDKTVDLAQISHAISPAEVGEYTPEEENSGAAPDQLMRGSGDTENEVEEDMEEWLR